MKNNIKFISFALSLLTFSIISSKNAINQYLITGNAVGLLLIPIGILLSIVSLKEIKIEGINLYYRLEQYFSDRKIVEHRVVGGLTYTHTKSWGVTRITVAKTKTDV